MGVGDRRPPPLPAPTETSSDNFGNATSDDLATDISRRTDRTSYSIPEDGSPVVISTKKKSRDLDTGRSNPSQTSLLIEYFEAGKSGDKVKSRPSVRVRVTPSRKKDREGSDHIQITETGKTRKPSYTRRISLGSKREESVPLPAGTDISGYSGDSNFSHPPVEIEVQPNTSDLSQVSHISDYEAVGPYPAYEQSDVSLMPPDSMLEGVPRIHTPPPQPRSPLIEEPTTTSTLRAPERDRSLSREREITHRVMERIAQREASGKASPTTRRSGSREYVVDDRPTSRKRTSSDSRRTEDALSVESVSNLNPSDISRRSERSARSGTSNVSINNPKLLATVEDAIKRLILPELNAVKEEQRIQRNRSKFEHERPESLSSVRSDGIERRMSKSSSAPDVKGSKPQVVVSEDVDELSPSKLRKERRSSKGSERSRSRQASSETVVKDGDRVHRKKSRDYTRSTSAAKEAALALGAGALTAAALKHHDSMSSVDSRERRRKRRSKSRSRTASLSESIEERPQKKESIPPLPMQSEIQSDLTRDSILSAETERPVSTSSRGISTPPREHEVRQVSRGSPLHVSQVSLEESPTTPTRTPTRTPTSLRQQLGTHHANISAADISAPPASADRGFSENISPAAAGAAAGLGGAAVLSRLHDVSGLHESMSANTLEHYTPQRPLSPIQSVSSYRDSTIEPAPHSRVQSIRSEASLTSPRKHHVPRPDSARSADSYTSSQSADFAYSKNRPAGFSLEHGYEIMGGEYEPETPIAEHFDETPRAVEVDDWFDKGHEANERYRHEYDDEEEDEDEDEENQHASGAEYSRDSAGYNRDSASYNRDSADYNRDSADYNRESAYTADSSNGPYDKVTAGQGLRNVHNNAEYVRTPIAVESAVASLHDPSSVSVHSSQQSLEKMMPSSQVESELSQDAPKDEDRELGTQDNSSRERWGVLRNKAQALHDQTQQAQEIRRSSDQIPTVQGDQAVKTTASALPIPGDDMPAIGHGIDDEELDTNPSIIRGPMAGFHPGDRSHWPYDPTPPRSTRELTREPSDDEDVGHHAELGTALGAGAAGAAIGLGVANTQGASRDLGTGATYQQPAVEDEFDADEERDFDANQGMFAAPNLHSSTSLKDEGYISSAQQGGYTPEPYPNTEDPFRSKRQAKHFSGMSHGMESPLYDAATGKGIDRIQSKDVVALMDHLTVRDAQRNARDTEILVTLVRSAAEMRNSFEEMKEFIRIEREAIMGNTDRNAEVVVQKVLGGPRPQPVSSPRTMRRAGSSEEGDDPQGRRKSMFKRALKGLSMRSTNDLAKIEDMLMQLLTEVEGLKDTQNNMRDTTRTGSLNSNEYLRQQQDPGYEPDGQAGTSSSPNQSGYFSNPSTRQLNGGMLQPMHSGYDGRRGSGHRISTVIEGDEEEYDHENVEYPNEERMTTPTQEVQRQNSLPMKTPPQQNTSAVRTSQGPEHTPKTVGSSKHRSQNSSLLGNFANKVSRWSKTTASTDPQSVRISQDRQMQRPYSEASRSGSNVNVDQYDGQYALNEDDRLRSNGSLAREQYNQAAVGAEQPRSPSPLIPDSEVDDPRYQAHRNSLNLQHPQPRPGPTHRHQSHLESEAQNYYESLLDDGPEADQWGSNPSLALNRNINRISTSTGGGLSPVYSDGASVHSASEQAMQPQAQYQNAPPRPPKIRDDGPLVPEEAQDQHVGSGGHYHNTSMSSGPPYLATPLEPIQEARYSLETERTGRHLTPSPNPPPTAMQSVQRRITGPRPMSSRSPSASGGQAQSPGGSPAASREDIVIRRKPVSVRSTASDGTLESYRSSLDEDNEIF
ncbi:hypothetical protein NA57DRAFT_81143 [Rhizodiscina lignyota]|uniref:Uncharacterized protein n=1 Tax=Rhizodiscina lignyota TaxID=1504668 RepID=A0A9P4M1J8_9PEZI|nr:hypothetical protein NA57DRAFT_81143 [Rhizodiscina lignyota]